MPNGRQLIKLPSKEVLQELFEYDFEEGRLRYLFRDRKWFKTNNAFSVWNSRSAGKLVGSLKNESKTLYSKFTLFRQTLSTHRVVWKFFNGTDPEEVDHIDGNPFNNRIENLQASDQKHNKLNQKLPKHNTSGYLGVSEYRGKWRGGFMLNRKTISVGVYDTPEEASEAVKTARLSIGFNQNHGERK